MIRLALAEKEASVEHSMSFLADVQALRNVIKDGLLTLS